MTNPNGFPTIDYARDGDKDEHRDILDDLGAIEPYLDETDWWCRIPVRITHSCLSGVCIELGPYTLGENEVERLRSALRSYDVINHGPGVRRIK